MKYYAVKAGRKTGVFNTWEECKEQVEGFENALYKSFSNLEEAESFLTEQQSIEFEVTGPIAYVDGSFREDTNEYSFGVVLIIDGKEYHFKKSFPEDELSSMRNVAGEIKGAGFIILYCLNRGINKLTIYHDYEGISKWYQNEWKANLFGTKKYQEFANEVKGQIDVSFIKVKSHSNNHYNDLADKLAKDALGIR